MPLSIGQLLENRYRIDGLLGQGGMGAVYRATDLRFGTPVAVKENRMASPESLKQFSREAELLHRLRHPNLPHVSDYFSITGQGQYLVMDYVEGEDLGQVLSRHGAIPEAQALRWIGAVLDALVYMHSQGILHRDVKPPNVRLTPQGQVFLVDFGLAKVAGTAQVTMTGARAVTPGYAPPEQYGTGRTDARTDIYSVGATLYALLTGTAPPDAWERVTKQAQLVAPRQLQAGVSPGTEAVVLKAMRITPDERFQTATEMRAALIQRPVPSRSQTRQPARPAWLWAAVGAAVILALSLVIGTAILLGGGDHKTPGPVAIVTTRSPSPTISPTTAPPTATTSPYLYQDDFGKPDSGWDVDQGSAGASGYVDGEYRLSQFEVDTVRWANPQPSLDLADFRVEVDARLVEGNVNSDIGVLVRSQDGDMSFYEFEISNDGYYHVEKRGAEGWSSLVDWTASPAIQQGLEVTNHLEVVCQGGLFAFFVNGVHLADLADSSYSSGNIGLSATCHEEGGVVVAFDNLIVRPLR